MPSPLLVAHGIGGRTDLPLSVWMFGYGASAALVVSFAALVLFWPKARLEPVDRRGDRQPDADDHGGLPDAAAGAVAWGRAFLRRGETFAAWFGLPGALASVRREAETGRWRVGRPLVGLAGVAPSDGLVALVLVALGSTGSDGLTRSSFWSGLVDGRSAVAGHVAGRVVLAHDRALARLPKAVATRSQYPLLVAMVAFTVGGLALLLGE